ncbi:transposase [Vibrio sp. JCM 19053]|nr:transposase [Vibrio sp. JCM 19053]
MFRVASSTLKDFAHRQNQGELGFTIVLHTHSRKRELHPHLVRQNSMGGVRELMSNVLSEYLFFRPNNQSS